MTANQNLLNRLFDQGRIDRQRRSFLVQSPRAHNRRVDFEKVEGMLLGLAVRDALGNTSESLTPDQRQRIHGEIRDYLVHRHANQRRGFPSDDSQLAFWTLKQLLADDGLVPENLVRRFAGGRIFGIGATVSELLANLKGVGWALPTIAVHDGGWCPSPMRNRLVFMVGSAHPTGGERVPGEP